MKKIIIVLFILAAALTATAAIYTQNLKPIKNIVSDNSKIAAVTKNDNITNKQIDTTTSESKTLVTNKLSNESLSSKKNNSTINTFSSSNVSNTDNKMPLNNKSQDINHASNLSDVKSKPAKNIKIQSTNTTKDTSTKKDTNLTTNSTLTNTHTNASSSSDLEESTATFNNTNIESNSDTLKKLQDQNKKYAPLGTAIVTNLNDYKIVSGQKYYNIYEYKVKDSASDWIFDGNYSDFLGAKYMNINGQVLNNQYIQNFNSLTTSEKSTQIQNVAKQFASYFNYTGSVNVHMDKKINFDGYTCYLVTFANKSFYINPAGFVYINKSQAFY